jgi:hypothetical protein
MPTFNPDLVDDLARQRVVLFLGAGVSASAKTHSGAKIKGWEEFLRGALGKVDPALSTQISGILDKKDFLLAAELLQGALRDDWEGLLTGEFGQNAEPSPLHAALISLDQRLIFTTNFDKLIESSWGSKIGVATHLPTVIPKIEEDTFRLLKDHSGKYLVKIHGTVDAPAGMIFSRSEYIRLAFGNILYSSFMEVMLLTHTFIFVGFSIDDPAISGLMEMYALRYPKSRPHYIIVPAGMPENIKGIFSKLRKLKVLEYENTSDHAELPPLVNALAEEVRSRRKLLLAGSF